MQRRRVSRDTRLLFGIVLVALATLWLLARIRFPDRVQTANPVSPVLAQLVPRSAFDDIASAVAQLEPGLSTVMVAVDVRRRDERSAARTVPALRFRDGLALTLMDPNTTPAGGAAENSGEAGRDPATGLTVVRVADGAITTSDAWSPRQPESPGFLLAAGVQYERISLRPVFVGSLYAIESPAWEGRLWALPANTGLAAGDFVFNVDGSLAGLAVAVADGLAIAPADMIVAIAQRVTRETTEVAGYLGIAVQPMTPGIAAATGASGGGVIVTWVDPRGPAAPQIRVTDVIEAVGGEALASVEHWNARLARLRAGQPVALAVWTRGGIRDIQITAVPQLSQPRTEALGLTLAAVRPGGVEVTSVQDASAGFRAGFHVGDVITLIGDTQSPTAGQVARAYSTAPDGARLLVGITRGGMHQVLVLERTR
jgi:PDZ domain-containing protein